MMTKTTTVPKNVYELAQERLRIVFNEFDNVYLSFSGGKDSGVLLSLCIDYIRRNNLKIKLGVFHMDYEIQYKMTIDYIARWMTRSSRTLSTPPAIMAGESTSILRNGWSARRSPIAGSGSVAIPETISTI